MYLYLNHGIYIIHTHFVLIIPPLSKIVSFMNFYPNIIFSLTYYIIPENRNKMKECQNISSVCKLKAETNSLQKCGATHKRSHTLVTFVTDGLSRVTLTWWPGLYWPTGCREFTRLMSINPLLVACLTTSTSAIDSSWLNLLMM